MEKKCKVCAPAALALSDRILTCASSSKIRLWASSAAFRVNSSNLTAAPQLRQHIGPGLADISDSSLLSAGVLGYIRISVL